MISGPLFPVFTGIGAIACDAFNGFVMTFRDAAARDAYLPHPEHQKFVAMAAPHVEKIVVFDYAY